MQGGGGVYCGSPEEKVEGRCEQGHFRCALDGSDMPAHAQVPPSSRNPDTYFAL